MNAIFLPGAKAITNPIASAALSRMLRDFLSLAFFRHMPRFAQMRKEASG